MILKDSVWGCGVIKDGLFYLEGKFSTYYSALVPMMDAHWKEVGKGYEDLSSDYELNLDMYKYLETGGHLITTGVINSNHELVGYMCVMRTLCLHKKGTSTAMLDGMYVKPEYRGKTGLRLIKFTENLLKDKYNIDFFQLVSNSVYDLGTIAKYLGYRQTDTVFMKRL